MAISSWQPLRSGDRSALWSEVDSISMTIQIAGLFDHDINFEEVKRILDERIEFAPHLKRKPISLIPGLTEPGWIEDPNFDTARHISQVIAGDGEAWDEISRVAAGGAEKRLPRDRPLWNMTIVNGIDSGRRSGAILRIHHALVDGSAVMGLALLGIDGIDPATLPVPPSMPAYKRSEHARDLFSNLFAGTGSSTVADAEAKTGQESEQGTIEKPNFSLVQAVKGLVSLVRKAPKTELNKRHGAGRDVAVKEIAVKYVRRAARKRECTANDIVLAAVTGGLHDLLEPLGLLPKRDPVALMPIARTGARNKGDQVATGNEFSTVILPLPFGIDDDQEIASTIRDRTFELLRNRTASGAEASLLLRLTGVKTPILGALTARVAGRMRAFNIVVSNVNGPPTQISMFGGPVTGAVGIIPLNPANQGVNVFVNSYARVQYISVVTAKDLPFSAKDLANAIYNRIERLAGEQISEASSEA